jgi:hypothetical protein
LKLFQNATARYEGVKGINMNATVEDLINTIGEQTVELRILRKLNTDLTEAVKQLREQLKQYEDQNNDKEEKKGK